MIPEASWVQMCIKSCDAQKQQLNDAARWHRDVASCARSLRNNHSPSPGRLSIHVFICGVMTVYNTASCTSCLLNSTIFIWLAWLWSTAVRSVDEVYLILCHAEVFFSKTLNPFSAHAVHLLTLTSDLSRKAWENRTSQQGAIYTFSKSALH